MGRARAEFVSIIRDLDACDDYLLVARVPSIQEGYEGVGLEKASMLWWMLKWFSPPATYSRAKRATEAVSKAFGDLARLTGKAVSPSVIRLVQHRVLNAFYPEIETLAADFDPDDSAHLLHVRSALQRHMEGRWRERS